MKNKSAISLMMPEKKTPLHLPATPGRFVKYSSFSAEHLWQYAQQKGSHIKYTPSHAPLEPQETYEDSYGNS